MTSKCKACHAFPYACTYDRFPKRLRANWFNQQSTKMHLKLPTPLALQKCALDQRLDSLGSEGPESNSESQWIPQILSQPAGEILITCSKPRFYATQIWQHHIIPQGQRLGQPNMGQFRPISIHSGVEGSPYLENLTSIISKRKATALPRASDYILWRFTIAIEESPTSTCRYINIYKYKRSIHEWAMFRSNVKIPEGNICGFCRCRHLWPGHSWTHLMRSASFSASKLRRRCALHLWRVPQLSLWWRIRTGSWSV